MTVYIDPLFTAISENPQAKRHGNQWCHLTCDGNLEELHQFAKSIGLRREWFQLGSVPHYDLTPGKRFQALKKGATELSPKESVPLIQRWTRGDLKETYEQYCQKCS